MEEKGSEKHLTQKNKIPKQIWKLSQWKPRFKNDSESSRKRFKSMTKKNNKTRPLKLYF
ncbi:hypothetical protein HYE05_02435 [Mycoplasmopsis bovis]|nr:hypothetical protein HYE05_02435 [Mycoplasmopsis bovis]